MTDLTDEHFRKNIRKNIRKNPDDDLALLIYADWLEEQGDERSTRIRLFQQAAGDRSAFASLESLQGDYVDFLAVALPRFSSQQRRRCFLDFAWVVVSQLVESEIFEPSLAFMQDAWRVMDTGPLELSPDYQRIHAEKDSHYGSISWMSFDAFYDPRFSVAQSIASTARLVYKSDLDTQERTQYLITLSYDLFGTNVLPTAFAQTGL